MPICSCVALIRWISRNRGASSARVPGSVVGGRSPSSSTSSPLSSCASRSAACSGSSSSSICPPSGSHLPGPMMDEQDFRLLDHKDRDGEIDLVVNMRHRVSPYAPRGGRSATRHERLGADRTSITPGSGAVQGISLLAYAPSSSVSIPHLTRARLRRELLLPAREQAAGGTGQDAEWTAPPPSSPRTRGPAPR